MMEHKAFVFDFESFSKEFRPIIDDGLLTGECSEIVAFIRRNLEALKDPYEGAPLRNDWESMIASGDVHQYGDFALTKYYDPSADIGLGSAWIDIQDLIADDTTLLSSPILGTVLGPDDNPFDPGKMGSYFQRQEQVRSSIVQLADLLQDTSTSAVESALQMLAHAAATKSGLYVTF